MSNQASSQNTVAAAASVASATDIPSLNTETRPASHTKARSLHEALSPAILINYYNYKRLLNSLGAKRLTDLVINSDSICVPNTNLKLPIHPIARLIEEQNHGGKFQWAATDEVWLVKLNQESQNLNKALREAVIANKTPECRAPHAHWRNDALAKGRSLVSIAANQLERPLITIQLQSGEKSIWYAIKESDLNSVSKFNTAKKDTICDLHSALWDMLRVEYPEFYKDNWTGAVEELCSRFGFKYEVFEHGQLGRILKIFSNQNNDSGLALYVYRDVLSNSIPMVNWAHHFDPLTSKL